MLVIMFDSGLKWKEQVSKAIREFNSNLYGMKIIKKYFTPEETGRLLTAVYYSKLYYGAEIWHLPGLALTQLKSLKFASSNALKACIPGITNLNTHTPRFTTLQKEHCLLTFVHTSMQ